MTQYGKNTLKYWHFSPAKIIFFQIMHISLKDVNLNVFDSQEITLQAMKVVSDVLSPFTKKRLCIVLRFL